MTPMIRRLLVLAAVVIVAGLLLALPQTLNRYGLYIMSMWAVMSVAAIGLNLTLGYAGQVSLAQGAFVGIGAYATAILTTQGWPLPVGFAAAIVLCFVVGSWDIRRFACSITTSPSSRSPSRRWPSSSSATRNG